MTLAMEAQDAGEILTEHARSRRAPELSRPIVHAGTVGRYLAACPDSRPTNTAVLLVSPWGFEEICSRKFWRIMAEDFAARGMASLRFDYPGTGDGLDIGEEQWEPDSWRRSVVEFAALLRRMSGCDQILLVGQGLGAALAYEALTDIPGVAGLALLAPVTDGRAYLRELSVWSRMSEPMTAGLMPDHLVLGGEVIAKPVTEDIRRLKTRGLRLAIPVFLAPREDQAAAAQLADDLRSLGTAVETTLYTEYSALVSNLTLQAVPRNLLAALGEWAERIAATSHAPRPAPPGPQEVVLLAGPHFVETHLRVQDEGLAGILCAPAGPASDAARVILLNPSYERAAGWGRSVAALSRDLAKRGIISLRFDMANVADSLPRDGAPEQVLYTESQQIDVDAAIDLMQARYPGPVVVAGRCSGAYAAFRSALLNPRVGGAVIGNAYTLEWDPRQSLESLLLFVPQSLNTYGTKILSLESWRKIMSGKVHLRHGLNNIARQALHKLVASAKPLLRRLGVPVFARGAIQQAVQAIVKRGTALSFVYTEGDIGLDHFRRHFDVCGERLTDFPQARFVLVRNAEHNMLTPGARQVLLDEIVAMAQAVGANRDGL